jgi:hypothetical protein
MSDDSDPFWRAPAGWALDQELEVAAEVYGPEPAGLRTPPTELSDEEVVDRYRSLLGFGLTWQPSDGADPGRDQSGTEPA